MRVIHDHAASSTAPLFMYIAWQAAHTPLEAPPGFHVPAQNDTKGGTRARMNGLVAALDADTLALLQISGRHDVLVRNGVTILALDEHETVGL